MVVINKSTIRSKENGGPNNNGGSSGDCASNDCTGGVNASSSTLVLYRTPIGLAVLMVSFLHMIAPLLFQQNNAMVADQQRHQAMASKRRWCMLTKETVPKKKGKWFGTIEHFPHTLEWYADCWTWLQESSDFAGADVLGGFIVDDFVKKKLHKKYWNRAFFPAMKFPVKIWSNETELEEPLDYSVISTKYYDGGWFQRSDTCSSFRERLWKNLDVQPPKYSKRRRRIGILNRNESRAIVNVEGLVSELQHHYKNLQVDIRAFDSEYELKNKEDTLQEQARWFADKDLIIMAHGAAMSNVVFMKPGSAIFELYPQYYFNDMFWDLMAQCQIYHSWYYDGNETEKYTRSRAQKETQDQWKFRMQNKKTNINFKWKDVDHVIKLLLKAVDTQR